MNKREIEIIDLILKKNGMFLVNNIEDFNLFLTGFIMHGDSSEQARMNKFLDGFNDFVRDKLDSSMDMPFYKIIRYYSSSDYSTMSLLGVCFDEYLAVIRSSENPH